jgi:hypothetical protein
MPAKGTHSLDPSMRGRGLRFSGSWWKVERTQSAMASAVSWTGMMLCDSSLHAGRWWCKLGGAGRANDIGARSDLHLSQPLSAPATLSPLPCRSLIACGTLLIILLPALLPSSPCKRSVSHVHASAFRRIRGTAHGCTSPQEPPRKTMSLYVWAMAS